MKVKVASIYHLRRLKAPHIIYLILITIIFMALNILVINKRIIIIHKEHVLVNNQEFVLKANIKEFANVKVVKKSKVKDGYKYRIANDLEGYIEIKYYSKVNLFKLLQI